MSNEIGLQNNHNGCQEMWAKDMYEEEPTIGLLKKHEC